jgi:quinol monooxygenase YgiN
MAQHVTFYKMQVQPGKLNDLKQLMEKWQQERKATALGWSGTIVGSSKSAPNEVWGAVSWDNTQNYMKNADSPEQNAWYQQMRALLAADPQWFDCDVVEDRRA